MKISDIILIETPDDDSTIDYLADRFFNAIETTNLLDKLVEAKNGISLGSIIGKSSKDGLIEFLLSIRIRVVQYSIDNVGLWRPYTKTIVMSEEVCTREDTTFEHELRHAVDTYMSGGRNYPPNHHYLPWDERPGELSAEYAEILSYIKKKLAKVVAADVPVTSALIYQEINATISTKLKSKLKFKPQVRKRLLGRLFVSIKYWLTDKRQYHLDDFSGDPKDTRPRAQAKIVNWNWEYQYGVDTLSELREQEGNDVYLLVKNMAKLEVVDIDDDTILLSTPGMESPIEVDKSIVRFID